MRRSAVLLRRGLWVAVGLVVLSYAYTHVSAQGWPLYFLEMEKQAEGMVQPGQSAEEHATVRELRPNEVLAFGALNTLAILKNGEIWALAIEDRWLNTGRTLPFPASELQTYCFSPTWRWEVTDKQGQVWFWKKDEADTRAYPQTPQLGVALKRK